VVVIGGQTPFSGLPSEPRLDGAILDPAREVWTSLPDLPGGDPMMAPGVVAATEGGGQLVVVGLGLVQDDAYAFEPGGEEWPSLGTAPVDTVVRPVAVTDGQWLFAGGGVEQSVAAVLDLASGVGRSAAAPPTGDAVGYCGAGVDGSVVAVAARWSNDTAAPMTVSWAAQTDTWTELSAPPLDHRAGCGLRLDRE
jgi:hypothetical protein